MKTSRARSPKASGFTLIEMVVSAALTALILTSAYLCMSGGFASQKIIEPRLEVLQNARVALALIAADLRAACPLSKDSMFLGMHRMIGAAQADNLDFATHNYTPRRAREGDYCQESVFLDKDRATGQMILWRRRNPANALDPLSGGSREQIASGLRGVQFEYYDGLDWYETWGDVDGRGKAQNSARSRPNLTGMPEAVRITLWFDSDPPGSKSGAAKADTNAPPLVFQTVARLNLASTASRQSTQSGGTDGSNTTGRPGPNAPNGRVN